MTDGEDKSLGVQVRRGWIRLDGEGRRGGTESTLQGAAEVCV